MKTLARKEKEKNNNNNNKKRSKNNKYPKLCLGDLITLFKNCKFPKIVHCIPALLITSVHLSKCHITTARVFIDVVELVHGRSQELLDRIS
jgi:hypothetical protein